MVSGLGIPKIDGGVIERAGGISPELSSLEMGIALGQLDPGGFGPMGSLKAFFTFLA